MAEHVHASVVLHEADWSSLHVLDRAGRKMERKIREAFHIYPATETSYEQGHRVRAKSNVECDPVEFSVGTGKVIWLWKEFRDCYSGVMPMFV